MSDEQWDLVSSDARLDLSRVEECEAQTRIVFAVFVRWTRYEEVSLTPDREYNLMRTRVSDESGLFMGSSLVADEYTYEGVFLFRNRLVTVSDIRMWAGCGAMVWEPAEGQQLEEFLRRTQKQCRRGGRETHGFPILVEDGDVETQEMLSGVPMSRKLGFPMGDEVAWWTRRMRWLRGPRGGSSSDGEEFGSGSSVGGSTCCVSCGR